MIDPATGALLLEGGVVFEGGMGKADFFASKPGSAARAGVANPPWESYFCLVASRDGTPLGVRVFFRTGHIKDIHLAHRVPPETEELELKRRHDVWLQAMLGDPPYRYDWGSVDSVYDPKSDSSNVIVVYGKPMP